MGPEHLFQIAVIKMAAQIITAPHRIRAFDRSANRGGMQHLNEATRGIRKGTPDTELICAGRSINIELKARGTKHLKSHQPSEAQEQEMANLRAAGAYAACAWSMVEVIEHWRDAGVPMSNMAHEMAEARDQAATKPTAKKPRAAGGPRKDKPSASLLGKVAAMRKETFF